MRDNSNTEANNGRPVHLIAVHLMSDTSFHDALLGGDLGNTTAGTGVFVSLKGMKSPSTGSDIRPRKMSTRNLPRAGP